MLRSNTSNLYWNAFESRPQILRGAIRLMTWCEGYANFWFKWSNVHEICWWCWSCLACNLFVQFEKRGNDIQHISQNVFPEKHVKGWSKCFPSPSGSFRWQVHKILCFTCLQNSKFDYCTLYITEQWDKVEYSDQSFVLFLSLPHSVCLSQSYLLTNWWFIMYPLFATFKTVVEKVPRMRQSKSKR